WEIVFIVCTAAVGIAALSFASVGYWLRNLFFWERLIPVAAAVTLITPGLKTDLIGLGLMAGVYVLQRVFKEGPLQRPPRAQGSGPATDAA
ncbi:MAG: hypothetical protein K2G99_05860, partial [Desulfovibrio sp.]|nr:hypothetical protein [Desulfovibrio sp.]